MSACMPHDWKWWSRKKTWVADVTVAHKMGEPMFRNYNLLVFYLQNNLFCTHFLTKREWCLSRALTSSKQGAKKSDFFEFTGTLKCHFSHKVLCLAILLLKQLNNGSNPPLLNLVPLCQNKGHKFTPLKAMAKHVLLSAGTLIDHMT